MTGVFTVITCVLMATAAGEQRGDGAAGGGRYGFYRAPEQSPAGSGRRMFGGAEADVRDFPAVCAILERYLTPMCSGAVIRPHWALTAAHCVTSRAVFVQYNAGRAVVGEGDVAAVHFRYRHPHFKVLEVETSRGPDVATLHHDVGLLRTRTPMLLADSAPDVLATLSLQHVDDLMDKPVDVLGFGRTAASSPGEALSRVRLMLAACGRTGWLAVACGAVAADGGSGVCAGDSGGPVLLRGVQVAVTSMGPAECAAGAVPAGAVSVLTVLRPYAELINTTVLRVDAALRARGPRRDDAAATLLVIVPLIRVCL